MCRLIRHFSLFFRDMMMQKAVTIATQICHLRKAPYCMLLLEVFHSIKNQRRLEAEILEKRDYIFKL